MKLDLSSFIKTMKELTSSITDSVKERVIGSISRNSAESVARTVMNHEQTIKKQNVLLGLTFTTYRLEHNGFLFVVESKGSSVETVIHFTITTKEAWVYEYHFYENKHTLNHKLKIKL